MYYLTIEINKMLNEKNESKNKINKNIRNKLMKDSIRLIFKLKILTTFGWIPNVPIIHKMMHQLMFLKSKKFSFSINC